MLLECCARRGLPPLASDGDVRQTDSLMGFRWQEQEREALSMEYLLLLQFCDIRPHSAQRFVKNVRTYTSKRRIAPYKQRERRAGRNKIGRHIP